MIVYTIQERLILSHLNALSHLCSNRDLELRNHQFAIARPILSACVKRQWKVFRRECRYSCMFIILLLRLLIGPRTVIIVGIAPFDVRLVFLAPFLLRHSIYLHTSWPFWSPDEKKPKPDHFGISRIFWNCFVSYQVLGIFCVSSHAASSIRRNFPTWPNCAVVGHTIDKTWFEGRTQTKQVSRPKNVAYVGRMVSEKGVDDLLFLAGQMPEVVFNFVGGGPMDRIIKRSNLCNVVHHGFINDRDELINLLDECEYIVQPSRQSGIWVEAFGIGVLEGMARGLVPITTDSPGSLEVLGPELSFLASPIRGFREHFLRIVKNTDAEQYGDLRARCTQRASEFAPEHIVKRWEEFLASTATNKGVSWVDISR